MLRSQHQAAHTVRSGGRHAAVVALVCAALTACGGGSGGGSTAPAPTPVAPPPDDPVGIIDLATLTPADGLFRVFGANNDGSVGVPVAAGADCDGDGIVDYAMAGMLASPLGRTMAGEVHLVFGTGAFGQNVDIANPGGRVLSIIGAGPRETAGDEIWLDDVTGDGIGDVLIGRQNFRASGPDRVGAGALTVLAGGATLRALAGAGEVIDLAAPPAGVTLFTLHGAQALDRVGIWMRTGDVTGDGVSDFVVGADQTDDGGENNRGTAWLVRGGPHLASNASVDLADFGASTLAGNLAKLSPPAGAAGWHFSATVQIADLDANSRAEVLVAATLSRSGASVEAEDAAAGSAESSGGAPNGQVYVFWDDNFVSPTPAAWPAGFEVVADATAPGTLSVISGAVVAGQVSNRFFGEEMLGGLDYDNDGAADLFVGDIRADVPNRSSAGSGHILFNAVAFRGQNFSVDAPPAGVFVSTLLGPEAGAIGADTALHGDFDGDGIADLAVASPLADPQGRTSAGKLHVLWGQSGGWPALIDLNKDDQPDPAVLRITDIHGVLGNSATDAGDILAYSAAPADLDGDGRIDLVVNEMLGNGVAADALDVGNLLAISGALLEQLRE